MPITNQSVGLRSKGVLVLITDRFKQLLILIDTECPADSKCDRLCDGQCMCGHPWVRVPGTNLCVNGTGKSNYFRYIIFMKFSFTILREFLADRGESFLKYLRIMLFRKRKKLTILRQ